MSFKDLIGNEEVKKTLTNAVETNKLTHSYMFIGPSGVGKTLFAREFAKMILCSNNDNLIDCTEIQPEVDTIKIDQIRRMRRKSIRKTNYIR